MSSPQDEFEAAQGWIFVHHGAADLIRKAIDAHVAIAGKDVPRDFPVTIGTFKDGGFAVRFPDGAPTFEFVNLIGWLNDPPEVGGVSNARGWITSPTTGIRYFLKPDINNDWGDTLIGASSDGKSVRVYLPEGAMCAISDDVAYAVEPDRESAGIEEKMSFSIVMDCLEDFGNWKLEITNPKDTTWQF